MSDIRIIAALDKNNGIGKNNAIPWRLSADMKNFSSLTKWHYVLMGRKTFESIGKSLKNRINLVVTRNKDYKMDNVYTFNDIESAIDYYKENNAEQILYVCGGSDIYSACISKADELNLSFVDTIANCDVFFPKIDFYKWQTMETVEYLVDDKNEYNFTYKRMTRKT